MATEGVNETQYGCEWIESTISDEYSCSDKPLAVYYSSTQLTAIFYIFVVPF